MFGKVGLKARMAFAGLAAACAVTAAPAPAFADWSKSYLVDWYELAMFYGRNDQGTDQPGTDCPNGINQPVDWIPLLVQGGMDPARAQKYYDPEFRNAGNSLNSVIPFRGPNGLNVYANPLSIPDPGLVQVTGRTSYGFDLDDNPNTGGFVSPDGRISGIDNAFYRTSGCILRFRGPPHLAVSSAYSMEDMRNGKYSIVIVLSGTGTDPRNDPNVTLGVYLAQDKLVKDAAGNPASGYTFRIDPKPQFQSVLRARTVDGVVETIGRQRITMRDSASPDFFPKELVLEQGRMRFVMTANGGLEGFVGGYRDWKEFYRGTSGNGGNSAGAIHENLGKFQLPAWYRALQRNADGMPDPVTGEMRGISTAYSISAIPAHVVTPRADQVVVVARLFPQ